MENLIAEEIESYAVKVCTRFNEIRKTSKEPLFDLVGDPIFKIGEPAHHRCVKVKKCYPQEKTPKPKSVKPTEMEIDILEQKREMDNMIKLNDEELEKKLLEEQKKMEAFLGNSGGCADKLWSLSSLL